MIIQLYLLWIMEFRVWVITPVGKKSWHGNGIKQNLDDIIGGHLFGLSLKGENDAMAKHIRGHGFDILGGDIGPALEKGADPGGLGQENGGPGDAPKATWAPISMPYFSGFWCKYQIDNVLFEFIIHVDFPDQRPPSL